MLWQGKDLKEYDKKELIIIIQMLRREQLQMMERYKAQLEKFLG